MASVDLHTEQDNNSLESQFQDSAFHKVRTLETFAKFVSGIR